MIRIKSTISEWHDLIKQGYNRNQKILDVDGISQFINYDIMYNNYQESDVYLLSHINIISVYYSKASCIYSCSLSKSLS